VRIGAARPAAWLRVRRPAALADADRALVARLCQTGPAVQTAYPLAQAFIRSVRARHGDARASWLTRAGMSGIPEVQSVVAGLRGDQAAVAAARPRPVRNGQGAGQGNRLTFIKRSGAGRAQFALLRQRVRAACGRSASPKAPETPV